MYRISFLITEGGHVYFFLQKRVSQDPPCLLYRPGPGEEPGGRGLLLPRPRGQGTRTQSY